MRTLTFLASDYPSANRAILDSVILVVVRTHFDEIRLEEYKVVIQCSKFLSAFCCRNTKLPKKKLFFNIFSVFLLAFPILPYDHSIHFS